MASFVNDGTTKIKVEEAHLSPDTTNNQMKVNGVVIDSGSQTLAQITSDLVITAGWSNMNNAFQSQADLRRVILEEGFYEFYFYGRWSSQETAAYLDTTVGTHYGTRLSQANGASSVSVTGNNNFKRTLDSSGQGSFVGRGTMYLSKGEWQNRNEQIINTSGGTDPSPYVNMFYTANRYGISTFFDRFLKDAGFLVLRRVS